MKKILTMILAVAAAVFVSVGAVAQATAAATAVNAVPQGDPTAFVFGPDKYNGNAVLDKTVLEPGVEYRFPVSVVTGGQSAPMTGELLEDFRLSYNKLTNAAVKTFKIEARRGEYFLFVELKESVPNEVTEVRYAIKLARREGRLSVFTQEVRFRFGYSDYHDDVINGLDKGEEVEITNDSPVITSEQFERIAKLNDYKKVTFSGPSWTFQVNVTDESTKNLLSSNAGAKEILARFPQQEFKFFTFPGKPVFSVPGKLALDVDDIVEEFGALHAYRYANGRLYALKTTLNEDTNMLELHTNTLDTFFVTDRELKNGLEIAPAAEREVPGGKKNPSTGA